MISERNAEETSPEGKKIGLSPVFFIGFLAGLILINFAWISSLFLGAYFWTAGVAAVAVTFVLAASLVFYGKKINRNFLKFLDDFKKNREEKHFDDQPVRTREEELKKANDKLQQINKEFMETTEKLFRRETELTRANKRLQELDKVKSEFVSVAAHQLRTPLTGIKWSYLTLLEKEIGPLSPDQKKIIEDGLRSINYAIDTINDLLNTARLEEGKTGFNFTVQPIGPVIQGVINQHKPLIDEKNIKLEVDMPLSSDLSPAFKFDKERISIVFDNILANAVKYTPPKGKISLKVFREGNELKYKIEDSGIGIPENDFDNVFGKFFRSKNAVNFETSGTGLGLYVVKNIVEKHGGTIGLESEEGKGTAVIFTLPIVGSPEDSPEKKF